MKAKFVSEAFHLKSPFKKKYTETKFKPSKDWKERFPEKPDPEEDEINELTQDDIDRQNTQSAELINSQEYWEDVAEALGGKLDWYDHNDRGIRSMGIELPDDDYIEMDHDWIHDGTPTKPLTMIRLGRTDDGPVKDLGRFAIWDNAYKYAEDLKEVMEEMNNS